MKSTARGLSIEDMPGHNRRVILRTLEEAGPCSRKAISLASGLDQATITRAVAQLISEGILEEVGTVPGGRGRRSINLDFAASGRHVLCLRLQRRSFSVATYSLRGTQIAFMEDEVAPGQAARDVFKRIVGAMNGQIADLDCIDGIGIAVPGPFLERDERVILMTESPEWQAFDIVFELRAHYPDIPVHSIHDAKAAALAEWRDLGRKRGARVLLYVSAGQGIGSALVIGGDVYHGALGLAGELGHTSIDINGPLCKCGNRGCLELYTSRLSLLRSIHDRAPHEAGTRLTASSDLAELMGAYAANDVLALAEVNRVARQLAHGIVSCANFANPDLIVIGDEYAGFGTPFLETVKARIKQAMLPRIYDALTVELSSGSEDTVLKGAFLDVMQRRFLGPQRRSEEPGAETE